MGKLLRLVSSETKRINLDDDGEDWIEVKADISKREYGNLASSFGIDLNQSEDEAVNFTIPQAMAMQSNLFETFVVGWSLTDPKGKALPVTLDNYLELSREASEAVDTAISEHFNSLTPSKDEKSKSN